MSLKDYVAVVTGGANGIGRATVERFVRDGARVAIVDTAEAAGEKLAKDLTEAGHEVIYVDCDVSDRLDVHNLVAATIDAFGRIDTLVNNAGIIAGAEFIDVKEEEFDRVLAVNLKGPFLVGQAVARQMLKQIREEETKPGDVRASIINMSSVNAVLAIPNQLPYVVSKGGLNQMTKVMALSLAPHGIRVNAIGPGSIQTDVLKKVMTDETARKKIMSRTPIGRVGQPAEIAEIAAFLASPAASYVTGACIYADGGRLGLNYVMPTEEDA